MHLSIQKIVLGTALAAAYIYSGAACAQATSNKAADRPGVATIAAEWREDWVDAKPGADTPFTNHLTATLCGENAGGKQANVLEAVQRFKSREAAEQLRGEQGAGLAILNISHPLIWSGAVAIAKSGEVAQSKLFIRGAGAKPVEVTLRTGEAKVPISGRICPSVPTEMVSQGVLAELGLTDGLLAGMSAPDQTTHLITGTLPRLAQGLVWTAALKGDSRQTAASVYVAGDSAQIHQAFDSISARAEPLGLRIDAKASHINGISTTKQRQWQFADGRSLQLSLTDGQAQWGGESKTTLMVTLSPKSPKQ